MCNNEATPKTYKHRGIVIAYMDGKQIQYKRDSGEWANMPLFIPSYGIAGFFNADQEYRIKPETQKYRVALMGETGTATCDSPASQSLYEQSEFFVRWLTDWVEYDI